MQNLRLFSLGLTVGLLALATTTFGAERAFEFTGIVNVGSTNYYGETISPFTPVTGGFVYESNSPATHTPPICSGTSCTGYEQEHLNGFWLQIDGVDVIADNYVIEVANDVASQFVTNDIITVRFASDLLPPLAEPLRVEGNPQSVGLVSLALFANQSLLSDSSLPNDLDPADFSLEPLANVLGDTFNAGLMTFDIDALFTMSTFNSTSFDTSDHDLDGDVDGGDFMIWQRHHGSTAQNGDADSNLLVNGSDLSIWRSEFGNTLLAQTVLSVPEPNSLAALCIFLAISPRLFKEFRMSSAP